MLTLLPFVIYSSYIDRDHLNIPENNTVIHCISDTVLIRQNEQDTARMLEALGGKHSHQSTGDKLYEDSQICHLSKLQKDSVVRSNLGKPLQSKTQSAVSCMSYYKKGNTMPGGSLYVLEATQSIPRNVIVAQTLGFMEGFIYGRDPELEMTLQQVQVVVGATLLLYHTTCQSLQCWRQEKIQCRMYSKPQWENNNIGPGASRARPCHPQLRVIHLWRNSSWCVTRTWWRQSSWPWGH